MRGELGQLVGGRYRLTESIGAGGMGMVWRARDEVLGRDVAIKEIVFPDRIPADERRLACARSLREARAAARLSHAAVITVHDVVEHDGRPWIVMELFRGGSLADLIEAHGRLQPQRVAEIGLSVLEALAAAHAAGIEHRDIKPANVMVSGRRVVLADFGAAMLQDDPALTATGMFIGTPAYLAPERARRTGGGPHSDLWSLGATLYAAVEGRPPFRGADSLEVLSALLTSDPPRPRHAGPLTPVLAGLMCRDMTQRLTVTEAHRMLTALTGPAPAVPVPAPPVPAAAVPAPPVPAPAPVPAAAAPVIQPLGHAPRSAVSEAAARGPLREDDTLTGSRPRPPEPAPVQPRAAGPARTPPPEPDDRRRGRAALLAAAVVLVLAAAGIGVAVYRGHRGSADFAGPGSGSVIVQVPAGATPASVGARLTSLGVVASASAFTLAARHSRGSIGLIPGYFRLRRHMKASQAWALLTSLAAQIQTVVTIPAGDRMAQVIARLGAATGNLRGYQQAVADTGALGLPSSADGNPEGYLWPATYRVTPGAAPLAVLQGLVRQFDQETASIGLAAGAARVRLTQRQAVIVASLIQAEGTSPAYYPQIARVIYNRLDSHLPLRLPATALYALGLTGRQASAAQEQVASPYNTFQHPGLPPAPIDSPGAPAIEAALHPVPGDWLYFAITNPQTGLTQFTASAARYQQWVAAHPGG